MSILLDIAGSLAIRGAIVLIILRLNISLQQSLMLKTATANVRAKLGTMVSIIETDIRQVGYSVTGTPFLIADSTEVKFLMDFGDNGTIDTTRYYLSNGSVFRWRNGTTATAIGIGLTQFQFLYYDATGVTTAALDQIRSIGLRATMEENYLITLSSEGRSFRPTATVSHHFFPPNL